MIFTQCNTRRILYAGVFVLLGLQSFAAQNRTAVNSDNLQDGTNTGPGPTVTVAGPNAPGVFHLVVNAFPNSTTPPASPFVVAPGESVPPPSGDRSAGTLTGNPKDVSNPLVLKSAGGKALLTLKTVAWDGVSTTFTFEHDPRDRFYGNGNESENHAGPLLHTSGKQVAVNAATTVPYIWSPSGYGILVSNDILDVNRHITWSDCHGTLTWTVPESFADIYLMTAADSAGVLGDYARLTGSARRFRHDGPSGFC